MLVRLLGPVDVVVDGVARPVTGLRRKAVLTVLGLAAGEVVGTERLLDVVWDGQPSAVGLNALQTHVSHLRRVLGNPASIVARGPGYVLGAGAATDLQTAVRLIEQARRESDPARRVARLRPALELWRGRPWSDVTGLTWLDAEAERVAALHLDAVLALTGARLELGEHVELVPELDALSRQHPYREDLCCQLMLALYRTGRQAEALTAYQNLRRALSDELGLDPGAAARDLEAAILRQDPAIDRPAPGPPDSLAAGAAHPLPPDSGVFTGRVGECEEILAGVVAAARRGRVMSVHAIHGMPGVGKTALAVHVAHRLVRRLGYPGVFVNLHGYTAGRAPADPADVLAGLLAADGFDARHLPPGVEARSELWRQRTADRSVLLVVDNAASSSQVVPLLPGSPGSIVLVTSRRFLGDLPVDAVNTALDVLTPAEAAEMFVRLARRSTTDPDAVAGLVELCGHLPLAIALLARIQVHHRTWTVGDLLAETRASLGTLTAEDRTVEAAFDLSYRSLPADRQRFFRHLGLHPGIDIDVFAAAALAGTPSPEAVRHLDALHADNLLVEAGYRRYTMHDLIRSYARRLADADPAGQRAEALRRLFGYYRYTAAAADAHLARHNRPGRTADPLPATGAPDVADATRALAWIRTERDNLLACIATTTDPRHLVALTASVAELLRRDGPWTDAVTAHQAAADAATELDDPLSQANAWTDLATVHRMTADYPSGERAGQRALDLFRSRGDPLGEANALTCLASIWRIKGDNPAAALALEEAIGLYREVDDPVGQADALTFLGTVRYMLDEYHAAAQALRNALRLCREAGDRLGEAHALTYLGEVLRVEGDYAAAVATLGEALDVHRDIGDRLGQANTLSYLGSVHNQTGDYPAAVQALTESLGLDRGLGNRLGQANALDSLAEAKLGSGDHPGAMRVAQEALGLYRALGHLLGQANALMTLGRIWRVTGDHQEASRALHEALDAFRELGDRSSEAEVLSELGEVLRLTGDLDRARTHHTQAVELARLVANHWDEAYALAGIGRCERAAGHVDGAVEHLSAALAIFRRIGAAEAAEVAAELDDALACLAR